MLVRATASLRLFEEALEEQGLPTYVVGGRGYWSQEQVRDGLAWLRVLANPHDEDALLTVLASPFGGAAPTRWCCCEEPGPMWRAAGRRGGGAWAARAGAAPCRAGAHRRLARLLATERERAERAPLEVLLERAIVATGYDLAVLARPGGDRRLANLRKLMRLAGEYERAEGRDLRGFLADAPTRDLAEAREGEAALESDGLDAIRLMTIHRAKGLEFPVVCVADLGRQSGGRRAPLLVGDDSAAGLRLAPLGGGDTIPHRGLGAPRSAEARRRRRGGTPPLLRRDDPRPGAADPLRRHRHDQVARPRAPAARRSTGSCARSTPDAAARRPIARAPVGRAARAAVVTQVITPETLPDEALANRAARSPAGRSSHRAAQRAGHGHADFHRGAPGAAAALLQPDLRLREVRLPLLPPARARPARRRAAAAGDRARSRGPGSTR